MLLYVCIYFLWFYSYVNLIDFYEKVILNYKLRLSMYLFRGKNLFYLF